MSELTTHVETECGSEKSFGIVFSIVLLAIALYPLFSSENIRLWSLVVAVIFFLLAFLYPKILSVPNKIWFKFGLLLGAIIAPIVMALVYFTTVLPIGLGMKLFGKDPLRRKLDKNTKSYWIERDQPVGSMKNQF